MICNNLEIEEYKADGNNEGNSKIDELTSLFLGSLHFLIHLLFKSQKLMSSIIHFLLHINFRFEAFRVFHPLKMVSTKPDCFYLMIIRLPFLFLFKIVPEYPS